MVSPAIIMTMMTQQQRLRRFVRQQLYIILVFIRKHVQRKRSIIIITIVSLFCILLLLYNQIIYHNHHIKQLKQYTNNIRMMNENIYYTNINQQLSNNNNNMNDTTSNDNNSLPIILIEVEEEEDMKRVVTIQQRKELHKEEADNHHQQRNNNNNDTNDYYNIKTNNNSNNNNNRSLLLRNRGVNDNDNKQIQQQQQQQQSESSSSLNNNHNNITLALLYPPGLLGGYRNQVLRYIAFIYYAKLNHYHTIYIPSLLWSTQLPNTKNNNNHNHMEFDPISFDWIFDVEYWNKFHEHLPRIIDKNEMNNVSDCWINIDLNNISTIQSYRLNDVITSNNNDNDNNNNDDEVSTSSYQTIQIQMNLLSSNHNTTVYDPLTFTYYYPINITYTTSNVTTTTQHHQEDDDDSNDDNNNNMDDENNNIDTGMLKSKSSTTTSNIVSRTTTTVTMINHLQYNALIQGNYKQIMVDIMIPLLTGQSKINLRKVDLLPYLTQCTNPVPYGGGNAGGGRLWNQYLFIVTPLIKQQRRQNLSLSQLQQQIEHNVTNNDEHKDNIIIGNMNDHYTTNNNNNKNRSSSGSMDHTYNDENDNNKTTIIFDTDIWIYRALRPAKVWRDVAHQCIHNNIRRYNEKSRTTTSDDNNNDTNINNNTNENNDYNNYIALHARVEIEMMAHPCGNQMERNFTKIIQAVYNHFVNTTNTTSSLTINYSDTNSNSASIPEGLFVAVSREGMTTPPINSTVYDPYLNMGKYNLISFNQFTNNNNATDDDNDSNNVESSLFDNVKYHIPMFECGSKVLNEYYHNHPNVPNHGTLLESVLNFYIAVHASIFIGVYGSSYSNDILTTRYYLNKGNSNYRYTNYNTIERVIGLPQPHSNCISNETKQKRQQQRETMKLFKLQQQYQLLYGNNHTINSDNISVSS